MYHFIHPSTPTGDSSILKNTPVYGQTVFGNQVAREQVTATLSGIPEGYPTSEVSVTFV